jgi:hypothetical protein
MKMNHNYEAGQKWDMRIEQHGLVMFKFVTIVEVTRKGFAIVSLRNPTKFCPDGTEYHPADPSLHRQLVRQV